MELKKKIEIRRFLDSNDGRELSILCLDYGYRLADTPADLTRLQIDFLMAALAGRMELMASAQPEEAGVTKFVFEDDEGEDV
jgi:hypothetical protein